MKFLVLLCLFSLWLSSGLAFVVGPSGDTTITSLNVGSLKVYTLELTATGTVHNLLVDGDSILNGTIDASKLSDSALPELTYLDIMEAMRKPNKFTAYEAATPAIRSSMKFNPNEAVFPSCVSSGSYGCIATLGDPTGNSTMNIYSRDYTGAITPSRASAISFPIRADSQIPGVEAGTTALTSDFIAAVGTVSLSSNMYNTPYYFLSPYYDVTGTTNAVDCRISTLSLVGITARCYTHSTSSPGVGNMYWLAIDPMFAHTLAKGVQVGKVGSLDVDNSAGGATATTVFFPTAYTTPPVVVLQIVENNGPVYCTLENVYADRFTFRFFGSGAFKAGNQLNWLAMPTP